MPDPLLGQNEFEREYALANRAAEFYGATIWKEGVQVFFEFTSPQAQRFVARLDCDGYPANPPDLVFLDPDTNLASADQSHWPPNSPLLAHPDGLHLCLPGTRWFERTHGARGTRQDRSLARILEVLAVCCNGQVQSLHLNRRRRR